MTLVPAWVLRASSGLIAALILSAGCECERLVRVELESKEQILLESLTPWKCSRGSRREDGCVGGAWGFIQPPQPPPPRWKMVVAWSFYPSQSLRNIRIIPIKEWTHSCLFVILLLPVTQAHVCTFHTVALMAKKPVIPNNCHILLCSVRRASLFSAIGEEVEVMLLKGSHLASQQKGSVQLLCPEQTEDTWQLGL